MSFRSIVRDVRDSFGSLSRRSFEVTIACLSGLTVHHRGKSQSTVHELRDTDLIIQESRWANLPPELLRDVIQRLEASESTWPNRKHVVSCAAVCRAWREMCREIVLSPEFSGKLTFPVSLKQVCLNPWPDYLNAFVNDIMYLMIALPNTYSYVFHIITNIL